MSKFFDLHTRTLHSVASYAGAVKLPKAVVDNTTKVKEQAVDDALPPADFALRRENAGPAKQFFSTADQTLLEGNYDLTHGSNADLVEVTATVTYR